MFHSNGLPDVVVVTIGTDVEVTGELLKAVGTRAWSVSTFHFDTYLTASRRPSIGARIKSADGCLVFVDFDHSPEEAVETTKYLVQAFQGKVIVIAVGRKPTASCILTAMRAGCSEFLPKAVQLQALDVVFDRLEGNRFAELERMSHPGTVLAVLGVKGGVGSTTLAVHLATYLARLHGKRTLLIDQQASLGHACVYLGLDGGSFAFKEVVGNLHRMDSELLQGFVTRHDSGLEVMSSPDAPSEGTPIHSADISRTLEFLRGEYDYIVIDCDRSQVALLTPILQAAAQFYLVATPEISAVRDLSRVIDRMLVVGSASEKLQVVVNRYNAAHAIPIEQIEKAMKLSVAVRIPNQFAEMVRSANTGQPLLPEGRSDVAVALSAWAETVAGSPGKTMQKRKEFRILSKWRQAIPAW